MATVSVASDDKLLWYSHYLIRGNILNKYEFLIFLYIFQLIN